MSEKKPPRPCSIEGCRCKHLARGWCGTHCANWLRHGSPFTLPKAKAIRAGAMAHCSVSGCGGIVLARGFCAKHYDRFRIHGSTDATRYSHKLSEEKVREIRELYCAGIQQQRIAPLFGISRSGVSKICWGLIWPHAPGERKGGGRGFAGMDCEKRRAAQRKGAATRLRVVLTKMTDVEHLIAGRGGIVALARLLGQRK